MTKERLTTLINKYYQGQCSAAELQELESYYNSLDREDYDGLPDYVTSSWQLFADQEYRRLQQALGKTTLRRKKIWLLPYKVAASVIGFFGVVLLSFYFLRNNSSHISTPPATLSYNAEGSAAADSRYLLLPDSSVVILHAGSSLKLDSVGFNKANREVVLTGEAFFDIQHNAGKPFIIHVGKAKVTVLGTAFNIKANDKAVIVTVARGKVKVEEGKRSSVLLPNQQVMYDTNEETATTTVQADAAVSWIKAGLSFNNERMDSIISKLETRYHVSIQLSDNILAQCRVSAGSPFSGTEPVEEILSLICPAINATFKKEGNAIVIEGPGCGIQ